MKSTEKLSPMSDKRIKDSIYDITYLEYVEAVTGDISVLKLSDDVTQEELESARKILMCEFAEISGNYEYIYTMESEAKKMKLGYRIMELSIASAMLQLSCDHVIFESLKNSRIIPKSVQFPKSTEERNKILKRINTKIEVLHVDVAEIQQQINSTHEEASNRPKGKASKRDFIKLLASVSQFLKFNVGFETNCAVVAEYLNSLRLQNEKYELENLK